MGDGMIDGLRRVLDLRQQQHHLVAGNLANAETPGFRAKSIDFSTALHDAMSGNAGAPGAPIDAPILEADPVPWSTDENAVLIERETANLQANAVMYRAVSAGLSRHLALMRFAAGDGR